MLVPMYPVLLYLIDFRTIFNLCNVFISLQLCFLKLVYTLETILDRMIDIPGQIMNNFELLVFHM